MHSPRRSVTVDSGMAAARKAGKPTPDISPSLPDIAQRAISPRAMLRGPGANAVLSGIMLAFVALEPVGLAAALATAVAILSGGMAVVNLIPFAGSDGSAILHAFRAGNGRAARDRSL